MDGTLQQEVSVSIIMPCYNASKYLAQAIDSALNQTYTNLELIIINDGSTDNSENIILSYKKKDSRIQYYYQSNQGVSSSRNKGLKLASGNIIAFLDTDDVWEPINLEIKIKALYSNPNVSWVYSDLFLADESLSKSYVLIGGDDTNTVDSLLSRTGDVIYTPSGTIFNRECFFKSNITFDSNTNSSEDWDLCLRITAAGYKAKRILQPLWTYRILPTSLSRNINNLTKGNLYVLKKADKQGLFASNSFKRLCYSNTYLILAGSWWLDGNNKVKGLIYAIKSIAFYPKNIMRVFNKAKNVIIKKSHHNPLNNSIPLLKSFSTKIYIYIKQYIVVFLL